MQLSIFDPWADPAEVKHEYGVDLLPSDAFPSPGHANLPIGASTGDLAIPTPSSTPAHCPPSTVHSSSPADYSAIILAVGHEKFRNFDFTRFTNPNLVVFDIKSFLPKARVDGRL